MNVDLLESVRHAIVYYPERFSAAQWAFARNADRVLEHGADPDGFRCCIAGHVLLQDGHSERDLLQAGGFHTGGALWETAARALDLNADRCRELFFPSQWDHPYKKDYYLCSRREEADVAAAYLDYFMQKYGTPTPVPAASAAEEAATDSLPQAVPVGRGERTPV